MRDWSQYDACGCVLERRRVSVFRRVQLTGRELYIHLLAPVYLGELGGSIDSSLDKQFKFEPSIIGYIPLSGNTLMEVSVIVIGARGFGVPMRQVKCNIYSSLVVIQIKYKFMFIQFVLSALICIEQF